MATDFRASLRLDLIDRLSRPLRTAVDDVLDTQRRLGLGAERLDDSVTRAARTVDSAAGEISRDADRAGTAMLDVGRDADRAADWVDRAASEMARDMRTVGSAAGRAAAANTAVGRTAKSGTGMMRGAWRALDVMDDIQGALGLVQGLTAGLVEMGQQAIESSRQFESAMSHLGSIAIGMSAETREEVIDWADRFAVGREGTLGGHLGQLHTVEPIELIDALRIAQSGGLELAEAQAATELAAVASSLADSGGVERVMGGLLTMTVAADQEMPMVPQLQAFADLLAETQRIFQIPALGDLIESIESSAQLVPATGLDVESWLAFAGTMSQVGAGSEAGEAVNTILESIVAGMQELGLEIAMDDAGRIDLLRTIQALRDYRLTRDDISQAQWPAFLAEHGFGELGSAAASFVGGPAWEKFTAGLSALRQSEGTLVTRAEEVAGWDSEAGRATDRLHLAGQVEVQRAVSQRTFGDQAADMDESALLWRQRQIQARTIANKLMQRSTERGLLGSIADEARSWDFRLSSWLGMVDDDMIERGWSRLGGDYARGGRLRGAGAAIPETLAEEVTADERLEPAVRGKLQRAVGDQLPGSDAERGPLSRLTAAGRAIPETLAEGVLQGAPDLGTAVTATLALSPPAPLLVDLLAGAAEVPELSPPAPLLVDLLAGAAEVPELSQVATGEAEAPAPPRRRSRGESLGPAVASPAPDVLLSALTVLATELRALRAEVHDSRTAGRRAADHAPLGSGEIGTEAAWLAGLGSGR